MAGGFAGLTMMDCNTAPSGVVPVPLRLIVCTPALSVITAVPLAKPTSVGAKASASWQMPAGGNVMVGVQSVSPEETCLKLALMAMPLNATLCVLMLEKV
jgi:hypothetical protein